MSAPEAPIRVALADDQALVRAGFRLLLDAEDGFEVVGEAADGAQAVDVARASLPDVVLMDVRMPVLDGIAATRQISADPALDAVRVLMLTTFELDEYVFEALRAGASGFLLKDVEPVELLRALELIAAGEGLLAPSVTRRLIAQFAALAPPPGDPAGSAADGAAALPAAERLEALTDREREVVALVGAGLTNHELAERLVISPATAKTHVSRAMGKLDARDRAQLVVLAYESGLVTPGGD